LSWFNLRKTKRDNEAEQNWHYNKGNNIKFYDEATEQYYEPEEPSSILPIAVESDENVIPIMFDVNLNEAIYDGVRVSTKPKTGKKRFYKPRKPIPKKIRNHLTALRGFACENCQENGYAHIHHVDGDHSNNQFENLRLLCVTCHKKIHAKNTEQLH
jgi:hypothetical protein